MTTRHLTYGSLLCGALTAATMPFVDSHPVVLALAFPAGALTFLVLMLATREWRPRRGH